MQLQKSRGGRPRKSPELRSAVISVRLTQEEWQYLSDLALNEGLELTDLMRSLLLVGMPESSESK